MACTKLDIPSLAWNHIDFLVAWSFFKKWINNYHVIGEWLFFNNNEIYKGFFSDILFRLIICMWLVLWILVEFFYYHYLIFFSIIEGRPFQKGCYPLLRTRRYPLVIMNMKGRITHVVIGNNDHYFTTKSKFVSSNPFVSRRTRYNIMWSSLSVICSESVVFSGYSGFLQQYN
jgi:hypothetical protein